MTKFKVGDWCFSHYELCQIKRMEGNKVIEVSTGVISRSGQDLTYSCFPLDMDIKLMSDEVSYWADRLHKVKGVNLNYPDIIRSLEERWVDMCNRKGDTKFIKESYEKLRTFCNAIIQKAEDLKYESVEGVSLIRH